MKNEEQIDEFREKAGIEFDDEDHDNLIPAEVGKLFFICGFNDGVKSPKDISTEKKILPDVFSMFYTNRPSNKAHAEKELKATEVDMAICHRFFENDA
jgi:hypothetical protein